jgi:SAM-dependent methyltransferase
MPLKYKFKYPIDSPERTLEHKEVIGSKYFLKKLYLEWYNDFIREVEKKPDGKFLELGSGGGFLKEVEPRIVSSDILDLPSNDMAFSALEMPFEDKSLDGIFMIDTFHHIPDSEKFLKEVLRTLRDGGVMIMTEPANSWWGRMIYQNLHHEPFNPKGGWSFPAEGPLSGANGALPWIVFERDREELSKKFPDLEITEIRYHTPFRYLVSGGLSFKQPIPDFTYPLFKFFDNVLSGLSKEISMFVTIKIKVKDDRSPDL